MPHWVGAKTGPAAGDNSAVREDRVITFGDASDEGDLQNRALVLLANQVRSLYCICYREFTGTVDYGSSHMDAWDGDPTGRSGSRKQNVWPRIAATIARCGADPFQFIRAQFFTIKLAKVPTPNTFYSDAAVQRWELFRDQTKKDLQNQVESDMNQIQIHKLPFTVNLRWPENKALDYTLRNPACGASPLIRYCYAVAASLPVAAEWHERALTQYMFQMSDYDAILQDRIPTQLKGEALECRRRLVGRD